MTEAEIMIATLKVNEHSYKQTFLVIKKTCPQSTTIFTLVSFKNVQRELRNVTPLTLFEITSSSLLLRLIGVLHLPAT